jgi:uncharacterized protein YecE (DUF72 family)
MDAQIGCSGYFYRGWAGTWYPTALKTSQWFRYYAERFDTVEINATFYRFPTESSVRRWVRQAPEGFAYSVKAPRPITHRKRLQGCAAQIAAFYDTLAPVGDALGCVLFQLPPSFHYTEDNLARLVAAMRPGWRNAVELRHASWWCTPVYTAFAQAGITFVSVHAPKLPDELVVTAGLVYLRLHGVPWYAQDYSEDELRAWAERIRATGVTRCWVYFNNDVGAHAPHNAIALRRLLAAR